MNAAVPQEILGTRRLATGNWQKEKLAPARALLQKNVVRAAGVKFYVNNSTQIQSPSPLPTFGHLLRACLS